MSKSSLEIKLLPQSDDDAKIASLLRLNPTQSRTDLFYFIELRVVLYALSTPTAPEERQQEVRQAIDSRPLFGPSAGSASSKRVGSPSPFVKNSRIKCDSKPLTRQNLGVSIRSKVSSEPSEHTPKQSVSVVESTSTRLVLCDYTSSSSSGEDS